MTLPFDLPLDVAAMIGFFAVVSILIVLDRKNIEFHHGLIIRRWKKGRQSMDKWIFSHRRSLNILGTIGAVIGVIAPVIALPLLIQAPFLGQQGAGLILPEAGDFKYPTEFVIGVPFWFWIVSIFIVLSVHEPMHAIYSRLAGVPVRSWGIMTTLCVPMGAFVDPDMKKVYKLKLMQKLKIFAGGSFGNFMAAGFFTILFIASIWATGWTDVEAQATIPDTPAAYAGVEGDLISVEGVEINGVYDLVDVLNSTPAGTEIEVITTKDSYRVVTDQSEVFNVTNGSYLGVVFYEKKVVKDSLMPSFGIIATWIELLYWVIIFNVGIGMFNTLPLLPFDGGHVFHALYQKIFKSEKKAKTAIYITSVITLAIVLFALFGKDLIKLIA